MELDRGTYLEGVVRLRGMFLSPAFSIIPFLFLISFVFPFLVVLTLTGVGRS